ncbi:MAG: hypothetical protein ABIA93_01445 [Candidatus Woesearchaeota archaeon]
MQVSIKYVEEDVFREFKAQSVKEGLKVGGALTLAMKSWLETKKKKPAMNILDYNATSWGKGTERTSEEIDKILY